MGVFLRCAKIIDASDVCFPGSLRLGRECEFVLDQNGQA
jgi:hypothetical protein